MEITIEQPISVQHEADLKAAIQDKLKEWDLREPAVSIKVRSALTEQEKTALLVLIRNFYVSHGYPNPTMGTS
ncbi:hypothetical protein NVIE_026670 [Nitrososphaera viennensis EN76]|uniref:Uncharacterized protein n=1 Tax=Nitrososphaera viennensis EN76 TaxID=926571 RepID=A0A060HV81_9ARCH|nr:hypothetical protein NVIE_026670 [Nitrososphaera viennensis EN76]CBX88947.1 hypothetical protein [Nitrososphaera phage Pro-Nvie1]